MGMSVEMEPLDQRALTKVSMSMIVFIGRQQSSLLAVTKEHIRRKFNGNTGLRYQQIHAIINADYVTEDYINTKDMGLKLTDKGWALVGGKPMWMEA